MKKKSGKDVCVLKKLLIFILLAVMVMGLCACGESENIVEDLEGPEGIDNFAGLWYTADMNLWIEIYYDGAWCSFEDGGMLRSYGDLSIEGESASLEPTDGEDRFVILREKEGLRLENGGELIAVTEVGITEPVLVNDRGAKDLLPRKKLVGDADLNFAEEYEGFYISEDGIYAIEIFADGSFKLQEYGMVVEEGQILRMSKTEKGELYTCDQEAEEGRLLFASGERLYVGGIGTFAPGEKSEPSDE